MEEERTVNTINDRSKTLKEFVPADDDDMIICRCEEITKGEIRRAVHDGMFTLTEIRRYLRTGMGLCQGQTCSKLVGNRCTGTGSFSGRTGTSCIQGADASYGDESVWKGGTVIWEIVVQM